MIKHFFIACVILLVSQSCQAQQQKLAKILGKWIVQTEQISYEKGGKTTETFDVEKLDVENAYVYHFKSDTLVTVTNHMNEFQWDFKIEQKDSVLTLVNINGDAEDDELIYNIKNDQLILVRKMEDEDPDNPEGVIHVCTKMVLAKMK